MEKRRAILISCLVCLAFIAPYLAYSDLSTSLEKVTISRVIDGDTLELEDGRIVRLININAPEKGKFFSTEATKYLERYINETVFLKNKGLEKYGRTLGEIYFEESINYEIVREGYAHVYMAEEDEEKNFKEAEKKARGEEKGIWKKSKYYGCLEVDINKYEEVLEIIISCDLDLTNWEIKDESTKSYLFKKNPGKNLIIYSGKGDDKENMLYWGAGKVWNDDQDSIFIRDSDGFLAYYFSYGY